MTNSETPPKGDVAGGGATVAGISVPGFGASSVGAAIRPSNPPPIPSSPDATGLKPCPFCHGEMVMRQHSAFHPENDCWLADNGANSGTVDIGEHDYASWNRRAPPSPQATREGEPDFKVLAREQWKHCGWEMSVDENEFMARYGEEMYRLGRTAADEQIAALDKACDLRDAIIDDRTATIKRIAPKLEAAEASLAERDKTTRELRQFIAHIHHHFTTDKNFDAAEFDADLRNLANEWVDTESIMISMKEGFERERLRADTLTAQIAERDATIATGQSRWEALYDALYARWCSEVWQRSRERDAAKARCDRFDQIVGRPMAFGHKSHIELAGMIRILGRNDLDHEPIVHAAHDRICWLADQLGIYKTATANALKSAELRLACAESAQERASRFETERDLARAIKDGAYHERNILVAALARLFPSGLRPTAIEGWNPEWHGCVYIDLPSGQISYHFHDREAPLFEGLPPYTKDWDGHDKDAVHQRLADIRARLVTIIPCNDCAEPNLCRLGSVCAKTLAAPQEGGPSS